VKGVLDLAQYFFDPLLGARPLFKGALQAALDLLPVVFFLPAVFFHNQHPENFHFFIGTEARPALFAFPTPPDRPGSLGLPGIHHPGLGMVTERAQHIAVSDLFLTL
jgi:hypothetical protein